MLFRSRRSCLFLSILCLFTSGLTQAAQDAYTRVYMLKNNNAAIVIQAINFAVPDPDKRRIISGNGKKLVITAAADQQNEIAELLPVMDQPGKETEPRRQQMEMIVRTTNYLNKRSKGTVIASKSPAASPGAQTPASGPAETYDIRRSTVVYKSIYSDEDSKLTKGPRVIREDPPLPSVANLKLKGIFRTSTSKPLALLSFEAANFTARDGGLFLDNRSQVKGVTTRILKDRVIVTGPDKIPREIKFQTSL